jgi:hypothetical protein
MAGFNKQETGRNTVNTGNDEPDTDPKRETGIGRHDALKGMAATAATAMTVSLTDALQKRFAPRVRIGSA